MKLYERIENNNFDEIDRNRAIELIEGGNGHLVYNENYFKLQKENEELKSNNEKYIIHLTDEQYKTVIEIAQNDINQKWIQKVKDKIEELKINLVNMQGEELLIYESKIDVLQELLESEEIEMEEKYINKILNFADENINTAKELVINKEQANGIIKELQEDYTPNAIIRLKIAEYKEKQNAMT